MKSLSLLKHLIQKLSEVEDVAASSRTKTRDNAFLHWFAGSLKIILLIKNVDVRMFTQFQSDDINLYSRVKQRVNQKMELFKVWMILSTDIFSLDS